MKKSSPLKIAHLVLMIAMACGTVGAAVNFIVGYHNASANTERLSNLMNVFLMAFILAMLVFGAMYLMKGYAKQAANDYKAFMILHIIVCALTIYIDLSFYKVNALMIAISVVNACKAVLLLILAFGKDIGRSRTWILFYILLALDIVKLVFTKTRARAAGIDRSSETKLNEGKRDAGIPVRLRHPPVPSHREPRLLRRTRHEDHEL